MASDIIALINMKKQEFAKIRKQLKKTQKETAALLGVSQKAVESYEQGLRNIPRNIERILYFLLFKLNRNKLTRYKLCWEDRSCAIEVRKNCVAWIAKEGLFCWFLTGKTCQAEKMVLSTGSGSCFECDFFKQKLDLLLG